MKAHVSSSAQEPIKEAALKKVISNAKVGAVEMFFMFRDLIVNMLDEGVKDISESVRENKINAAAQTRTEYNTNCAYTSAIDEFIVDLPNNDFSVKFDGTPEKLQSIVTDKFRFELSLALEFDIRAFLEKSGMTREEFEVIAANALMLAEQNGGIKTYLFKEN